MNQGMLVLGVFFAIVGTFAMVFGGLIGRITLQVPGVIVYACSIPLLFQVRFSEMEKRITELENRVKK